jgi:exodeoxyribonuclease VII small subunit
MIKMFINRSNQRELQGIMAKGKKKPDFEQSLAELEALVDALEAGDLSLEQSLTSFEKGIALTRTCQAALNEAEQTVKILTEKNGQSTLDNMPTASDDD